MTPQATPAMIDASFSFGAAIASIIGLLVTIVGFLIVRTLNHVDRTLTDMAERFILMDQRVSRLEGFQEGYGVGKAQAQRGVALPALAFLLLMLSARVAFAQATPTPATFNPLPQQNASFFTTLRTFLLGEDADRYASGFYNYRIAGCTHGTAAGMVGTFSSTCEAIVNGAYVTDPAASIDYSTLGASANDFCWVIVTTTVNEAITGFTRLAGTHYMADCTAPSTTRPTITTTAMVVMGTTITGGAILSTPVSEASRVPAMRTYTNSSEIDVSVEGSLWYDVDTGLACIIENGACRNFASADANGCAQCGDNAAGFWLTGACEPLHGCTGDDTSATTGVPYISAGNWQYESALDESRGGLGTDFSACTGWAEFSSGTGACSAFPASAPFSPITEWGVDGTQCTKDDTGVDLVTNVPSAAVACADNSAGRIAGVVQLPGQYTAGSAIGVTLTAVQSGSTAGVVGFDYTCLCVRDGTTVDAANFPSVIDLDLSATTTTGETILVSGSLTCGGSCVAGDRMLWRGAVDTTATTHTAPTEIKLVGATFGISMSGL